MTFRGREHAQTEVRTGMPSVQLTKEEFSKRFRDRFYYL
jgi:hypothetical protein